LDPTEREALDVPEEFLAGMTTLLSQHNTLSMMQIMACISRAITLVGGKEQCTRS